MPEKRHRLRVHKIDTIGFVPEGDDPKAEVVFYKAKPTEKAARTFDQVVDFEDISDELWQATSSLQTALREAVLEADEGQDRDALIAESLEEFSAHIKGLIARVPDDAGTMDKTLGGRMLDFLKTLAKRAGMSDEEVTKLLPQEGAAGGGGTDPDDGGADPNGGHDMPFDITNLDAEARAEFEKLQKRAEDAEAKLAEANDGGEGGDEVVKTDDLPEPVQKAFSEMEKRLEDERDAREKLEKQLADRDAAAERDRFIAKARGLNALPGASPDDLAPILQKAFNALDEDERAKFDEVLKAANKTIQDSPLFREIGGGGEGTGASEAEAEVDRLAKEKMDADPSLTLRKARGEVYKERPSLLDQVEKARAARTPKAED